MARIRGQLGDVRWGQRGGTYPNRGRYRCPTLVGPFQYSRANGGGRGVHCVVGARPIFVGWGASGKGGKSDGFAPGLYMRPSWPR